MVAALENKKKHPSVYLDATNAGLHRSVRAKVRFPSLVNDDRPEGQLAGMYSCVMVRDRIVDALSRRLPPLRSLYIPLDNKKAS